MPVDEVDEFIAKDTVIADRYRVLGMPRFGGMGTVYVGEHVKTQRPLAIKVLKSGWSSNAGVVKRFRREAESVGRLSGHPNIVEVIDIGELDDGRLYLVMELVSGDSLAERIDTNKVRGIELPIAEACRTVRDIARALHATHLEGVVHRDLKPDNVMFAAHRSGSGEIVKVLDFGVAALTNREDGTRLTKVGQAIGTPAYMAPEQAMGRPPTPSIDIYALGVLLFEILTGNPPFMDAGSIEVLTRKNLEDAPLLSTERDGVPPALDELVAKCLSRDPDERPANAQAFIEAIEAVLQELPRTEPALDAAEPEPVEPPPPAEPRTQVPVEAPTEAVVRTVETSSPRRPWVLGLLAIGGAAIVAITWWTASSTSNPATPPPKPEPAPAVAATHEVRDPPIERPGADEKAPIPEPETKTDPSPVAPEPEPTKQAERPAKKAEAKRPRDSEACKKLRADAEQARDKRRWRTVLTLTRKRECWPKRVERLRLQVRAHSELNQHGECIRAGERSKDPEVQRRVKLCRANQK